MSEECHIGQLLKHLQVKIKKEQKQKNKSKVAFLHIGAKSQVTQQLVSQEVSENNQGICCWEV